MVVFIVAAGNHNSMALRTTNHPAWHKEFSPPHDDAITCLACGYCFLYSCQRIQSEIKSQDIFSVVKLNLGASGAENEGGMLEVVAESEAVDHFLIKAAAVLS